MRGKPQPSFAQRLRRNTIIVVLFCGGLIVVFSLRGNRGFRNRRPMTTTGNKCARRRRGTDLEARPTSCPHSRPLSRKWGEGRRRPHPPAPLQSRRVPAGGRGEKLPPPSRETQREITAKLSEELGFAEAKDAGRETPPGRGLVPHERAFCGPARTSGMYSCGRSPILPVKGAMPRSVMAAVDATAGQFQMNGLAAKECLLNKFAAGPVTARGSAPSCGLLAR